MSSKTKRPAAAPPPVGDVADHTNALTMSLDDHIPETWQHWRDISFGPTLFDLLETMETEASSRTFWPQTEITIVEAQAAYDESPSWPTDSARESAQVQQASQERDQALRLGYALAMTREHAWGGPERWYNAALAYAGITLTSEAESKALYDHLDALYEAQAERHGWL